MFVYIDQHDIQMAYLVVPNSCMVSNYSVNSVALEGTNLILLNQNSNGCVVSIELKNEEFDFAFEKIYEFLIEDEMIKFIVPNSIVSSKLTFAGLNLLFRDKDYRDFVGIEYANPDIYGFGRLIK